MRRLALLLVAGLAACARMPATMPVAQTEAPAGTCRIGADGGIPVADRGIGGTGITGIEQVADRGIGGTGAKTGIVGVITGFASVCLAGQEVQYPPTLPVTIDGRPADLGALRAGQVAVIEAVGPRPVALSLIVRHEVSGPVERIEPDGTMRVAGQPVIPPPNTPAVAPGAWLQVSGFRRGDGTIIATRIDLRGPGETMIRGVMTAERGHLRIGSVEIRPGRFQFRQPGIPVTAVGRLNDGILEADTVEPDALLVDPGIYFGTGVGVLFIEGYAEGGYLRFGRGLRFGAPIGEGRAFARLERGASGGFTPAFVRPSGEPGQGAPFGRQSVGPRAGFEPAPMPNRALDRAAIRGGGRPGQGRQDGGRQQRRQQQDQQGDGSAPQTGPQGAPGGFGGGGQDGFRFRPSR